MDKISENNAKKEKYKKAEFYIKKYLGEISVHFDLEKSEIKQILTKIIKGKDTSKKWWQIFSKSL
jgi:CRISPR/Cas system CSM-associated protein Csm4 (group 5 of RAMP superfamily)